MMNKKELVDKIEKALDMIIAVSGRKFRILRDKDDCLVITERSRKELEKLDAHRTHARENPNYNENKEMEGCTFKPDMSMSKNRNKNYSASKYFRNFII